MKELNFNECLPRAQLILFRQGWGSVGGQLFKSDARILTDYGSPRKQIRPRPTTFHHHQELEHYVDVLDGFARPGLILTIPHIIETSLNIPNVYDEYASFIYHRKHQTLYQLQLSFTCRNNIFPLVNIFFLIKENEATFITDPWLMTLSGFELELHYVKHHHTKLEIFQLVTCSAIHYILKYTYSL